MTQPKTTSKFTPGAYRAAETIFPWLSSHYQGELNRHRPDGGQLRLAEIIDRETHAPEMYELLSEVLHDPYMAAATARRIKAEIDGE